MASLNFRLPSRRRAEDADPAAGSATEDAERARKPRSRALPAAVAAILLVLATAVVIISSSGKSGASQSNAIQGSATATVQRRDLVETDTETGTLGYRDARNIYNHLSGTVTWVAKAGATIHADGVLYRVDGKGVYLFNGVQPAYRAFKSGMSNGRDVLELNRALHALGFDEGEPIDVNDEFSEATAAAIRRWQAAHGFEETGEIELGRVVFQPGDRRVQSVSLTVGSSASGSGGGEASASSTASTSSDSATNLTVVDAGADGGSRSTVDVSYVATAASTEAATTTTTEETSTTPEKESAKTAPEKPKAKSKTPEPKATAPKSKSTPEQASSPTSSSPALASGSSAGSSASSESSGTSEGSSPSNLAIVTTSLDPVVTVALETSKANDARVGGAVQVTLPSNEVVDGHIIYVSSVAETSSSSSSSSSGSSSSTSTVNVEISLASKGRTPSSFDKAPVSVAFAAEQEKNALSVPVTALVATAGGGYAVEVVEGPKRRLVSVSPGLFAGGYVAVSGVNEGTVVTNGAE